MTSTMSKVDHRNKV